VNLSEIETHISFGRDEDTVEYTWQLMDNAVTPFWLKYFTTCLQKKILFKPRFMGFVDGERNFEFLQKQLNECIDIINSDGRHKIDKKLNHNWDQEFSNYIHHHFEVLMGDEWNKSDYWKNSNEEVCSAVCGLNDYTHELEAWHRASEGRKTNPEFTMAHVEGEFFEGPGMDIKTQFHEEFTLETSFGDMVLHYTQIGKTWLEVCIDQDEDIFDPAIQPLWKLSGSFNILFNELDVEDLKNKVMTHLKKLGKDPSDPTLRLGMVPVAKLVSKGESNSELVKKLSVRQDISKIEVCSGEKVIASHQFPPKIERYFVKGR
jgi:hypothetical protein